MVSEASAGVLPPEGAVRSCEDLGTVGGLVAKKTVRSSWALFSACLMFVVALTCAPMAPAAPPPNDDFANATVLTGLPTSVAGTNTEATVEVGEPELGGFGWGRTVWYSWQAPVSGWVTVSPCGNGSLKATAVYTGNTLGALTRIAASDPEQGGGCGFDPSQLANFRATAGVVYRIAVDGKQGDSGHLQLEITSTSPPAHDDFAYAEWLGGSHVLGEGTNVGATKEAGEPQPNGDGGE